MFSLCARESDKIIGKLKRLGLLWSIYAQFSFGIGLHTHKRHRLPKTSLRTAAFQPHRLELLSHIKCSRLTALCPRATTFKTIVRKKFDVRAQSVFANLAGYHSLLLGSASYGDCDDNYDLLSSHVSF